MAEKKQDIKDGKNIELDDITVLNNVSVAEKAEVKEETKEISTEEVPSEEVKAESSEAEVAAAVEVPTVEEETKEDPFAGIDGSIITTPKIEIPIVSGVASENSDIVPQIPVVEETNTFEIPTTDYNLNTQNPNEEENAPTYGPQLFGGNLDTPSWQNDSYSSFNAQNSFGSIGQESSKIEVPDGVKAAIDMIKNEAIELATENKDLKNKNTDLENINNDLRREVADLQARNKILETEKANMQNSITNVQSRILDVFGASNLMQYNNVPTSVEQVVPQQESKMVQFPNYGDEQFGGNGMNRVA